MTTHQTTIADIRTSVQSSNVFKIIKSNERTWNKKRTMLPASPSLFVRLSNQNKMRNANETSSIPHKSKLSSSRENSKMIPIIYVTANPDATLQRRRFSTFSLWKFHPESPPDLSLRPSLYYMALIFLPYLTSSTIECHFRRTQPISAMVQVCPADDRA